MKCRQCGKEFDQENKICPHCGFVHDLDHSDIPSELNHLSLRQIKKHLSRQHYLKKFKYLSLLLATHGFHVLEVIARLPPLLATVFSRSSCGWAGVSLNVTEILIFDCQRLIKVNHN